MKEDKWEYCEHNNLPTETRLNFLNKMGQLGWQLCLVRGGNNYIFKRKIINEELSNNLLKSDEKENKTNSA